MTNCSKICGQLFQSLTSELQDISVHSWFDTAGNFLTPFGLVTVLPRWKSLQPHSLHLATWSEDSSLFQGRLSISLDGIWRNGLLAVSFSHAQTVDLSFHPPQIFPRERAELIRQFLLFYRDYEFSGLLTGSLTGPFAREAAARFFNLRLAVAGGRLGDMVSAAARLAGCGTGLTPSSDDLLCGYFWALLPRNPLRGPIEQMAEAAARRTNDISASLLQMAGRGFFSEDVLSLSAKLFQGGSEAPIRAALQRVSSFGCTSGRDFLTGGYFGIIDACTTRRNQV